MNVECINCRVKIVTFTFMLEERDAVIWKQTWGMYSNSGVKNKRAQPIMSPAIIPANPVFAPLSLFTADLEKDPM